MKVLIVTASLPVVHGSGERGDHQAQRLGEALEGKGSQVNYFTRSPSSGSLAPENIHFTRTMQDSFFARIPWMFDEVKSFGVLSDSISAKEFTRVLDKTKPDVVHFHHLLPLSLKLMDVTYFKMIPSILSMQDYQYLCMKKTLETGGNAICTDYGKGDCLECMGMNKFRMTRKYLLEMRGNYFTQQLDKTDLFVVPSLEGKKHLVNAGFRDERIQVVSNLLDIPDIPQMENPDMGLIVFLGDISPQAGADVALEAFKKVFDDVGHCRMAMVGRERDTEYMEEKKTWLKNNKLQEQVKFITSGDAGEMAHYLASAEVVVVADQWPDMFNEKILTTLAFGRPVVAGDVGNARELVESGRTGFLVKYNDPGQYAKMIINIIRNPENSYNLGRTARSGFYQLYQPHEITGRMLDIYQALVDTYQKKSTAGKGTRNKEPDFSG